MKKFNQHANVRSTCIPLVYHPSPPFGANQTSVEGSWVGFSGDEDLQRSAWARTRSRRGTQWYEERVRRVRESSSLSTTSWSRRGFRGILREGRKAPCRCWRTSGRSPEPPWLLGGTETSSF
jgi:hypothetical protein